MNQKIWPFFVNIFLFAGYAFVMPFLVLYYQSIGFSGIQIGLLTGITPLIAFFCAPLWTRYADATHRHRVIMSFCLLAGVAVMAAMPAVSGFLAIMTLIALFNVFFSPVTSFTDSSTMHMLGAKKDQYGRVRLGGTIGFAGSALVAGVLIESHGLQLAFWGAAALFFFAFLSSQGLRYRPAAPGGTVGGLRTILRERRWLRFLLLAFGGGVGLAMVSSYLLPLLKSLGATETEMGIALSVGTLSEFPVLFFGNRLIRRFGAWGLFVIAMLITGLRLVAISFCPSSILVLGLQTLNGFTFPTMWIAGVAYADHHAPEGMHSTVQGLFSAMNFGIGIAVGGFLGGMLLEFASVSSIFLAGGSLVLLLVGVTMLLRERSTEKLPVKA